MNLRPIRACSIATLAAALAGCGGTPSAANIKLRKSLSDRDAQIDRLNRQHLADVADVHSARSSSPTTSALPPETLGKLFTTHGIAFGRLTGGYDRDSSRPGDEGLKIYVVPTDDENQPIKAAGSFKVDAYDLADNGRSVGHWEFDQANARSKWFGAAMLYTYVLTCPWQETPKHTELTVRVTFNDELTGREFSEQKLVAVKLPPATIPTTAP